MNAAFKETRRRHLSSVPSLCRVLGKPAVLKRRNSSIKGNADADG